MGREAYEILYEYDEREVSALGVEAPEWITDPFITTHDVAAIIQGGCASGAYMPAVTYHEAAETMGRYGDDVLQYIQDTHGELPKPSDNESWSGMACFYLSAAVERWALDAAGALAEALEAEADEDEDEDEEDEA